MLGYRVLEGVLPVTKEKKYEYFQNLYNGEIK